MNGRDDRELQASVSLGSNDWVPIVSADAPGVGGHAENAAYLYQP